MTQGATGGDESDLASNVIRAAPPSSAGAGASPSYERCSPRISDATAPRRLATTPTKNARCRALMNGARLIPPPPICVPEKTATSTFGSIEAETRPIASAIDTTKPDCMSIIRVPAPTPRLSGGTTPITALVFGELKMPDPAPTTSCQKASCQ